MEDGMAYVRNEISDWLQPVNILNIKFNYTDADRYKTDYVINMNNQSWWMSHAETIT